MNSIKGQMSIYDYPQFLPGYSKEVNIRGICDDGYCPDCNAALDDLISECPFCGLSLTWESWKKLNKEWLNSEIKAGGDNE